MTTPATPTPAPTPAPKKSGKSTIIIAILSVLVLVQSVKIYLDYQEKVEVKAELATTEEDLASTMQRLNDVKLELDQKIEEIAKLGGDVTELEKAKAEVTAELKRSNSRNSKAIKELKDRLEGYEQLLKIKDEEIDKLKSLNQELYTENRTLKTKQNVLSDSLNKVNKNKAELATKVALASQLKAENINLVSVNDKGKEKEPPFRKRQLEKIKVEFTIADNKVAPIEGKKILVRVIDQNGQPIFDTTKGSGTFILNGKEEFFTSAQEILFDNTGQKLSFTYDKGSEYTAGSYTVEIFTDGYLMGSTRFEVR
ncbi:MAG TPA: chromosome segregation protein SMC [Cyclobacteriaceae bacterium]|jgi:myosin heavy subunit|nr:chromosome segregation protein SMC [Cytophagales bacterium]HMR57687.1 chromosome segregation protein SMC [Cyclobacteriaceae bacterium]HRE68530.1 chromosome segregation protein SMC [Cyclobacteriaceae bacterium]HRF34179.1 chromosome segregation protein SMC [Cyclobacteriaceae bacterium]